MDANEKAALAEAVNTLIDDSDAANLYKQLMGVHELARKNVPVRLTGRPSVLNPLLDLLLTDYPAAERVIQLICRKRSEAGLDPLDDNEFDRKSYMRELMATKRERQRRLVELWNMLRPEADKLRGTARVEFERIHGNRWFDVRTEREAALRAKLGRRLTVEERSALIAQLWEDVNQELDDLEHYAREQMRKPSRQWAPEGYQFKLQPKKGS